MEGFTRDTSEIDIQKVLMDTFDVKEKEFASIKKDRHVVMLDSMTKKPLSN